MKFQVVTEWRWTHFFRGDFTIQTRPEITQEQVIKYIEGTLGHGNGNWQKSSLECKQVKVKTSKLKLVEF